MKQQFCSLVEILEPVEFSYYFDKEVVDDCCQLRVLYIDLFDVNIVGRGVLCTKSLVKWGLASSISKRCFCVYAIYLAFMKSSFSSNGHLWCREEERQLRGNPR